MECVDLSGEDDGEEETQANVARIKIPKEHGEKVYYMELKGKPKPFPRPEFIAWIRKTVLMRRVVNKAKECVLQTRLAIKQHLQQTYRLPDSAFPLCNTCRHGVIVFVKFYRRLPNTMFKSNNRTKGLKRPIIDCAEQDLLVPDADNLLKFLLEALKEVAYKDDNRVVKVVCTKLLDSDPPYNGRTIFKFRDYIPKVDGPFEHHFHDENGFEHFK